MAAHDPDRSPTIRKIGADATARLTVQEGDYLLWVATDSPFTSDAESGWTIRDFWQFHDGDSVTITNRWADLPAWFELQPPEVAGRAVHEMTRKLAQGFQPSDPLNGPNIWRVKAGERLVLVATSVDGGEIRELVDFRNCALVLGETDSEGSLLFFGAPDQAGPSPRVTAAMRKGFEAAVRLGTPRTFSPEWLFGA